MCSDIARYGLRTPGEPTQGAGAVAFVVSAAPRMLAIDGATTGRYSAHVFDFWRPLDRKDALVDGRYSVACYLDAVRGAFRSLRGESANESRPFSDRYAAMLYHVPYGKMARKAHATLRAEDGDETPDATFDSLVAPSLVLPSLVGNIYTGSLYLALLGLLASDGARLAGARVSLFSYGSGSCAELFEGTVVPGAHASLANVMDVVGARERIDVATYEALFAERDRRDASEAADAEVARATAPRFFGSRDGRRIYG